MKQIVVALLVLIVGAMPASAYHMSHEHNHWAHHLHGTWQFENESHGHDINDRFHLNGVHRNQPRGSHRHERNDVCNFGFTIDNLFICFDPK